MELGWKRRWSFLPQGLTPWRWRNSAWMMSKVQSAAYGSSLFPHLLLSVYMAIPVSGDTVLRSTCSQSQSHAPSCLQQGCWQWPIESYVWGPHGYPSVYAIWALILSKPYKNSGWPGHACQPSTINSPRDKDFKGAYQQPHKGLILETLDLQDLEEWPEPEQEQARELPLKWEHLFVHSDLDLGRTTLIKHKNEVTDQMPSKEHYQCIPLHMYNDVKPHL